MKCNQCNDVLCGEKEVYYTDGDDRFFCLECKDDMVWEYMASLGWRVCDYCDECVDHKHDEESSDEENSDEESSEED